MTNCIRTAFLLPSGRIGGAERVFGYILQNLDRQRFDLHLILVDSAGPMIERIPTDVGFHTLDSLSVRRAGVKLFQTLRRLRPQVLLSTIYHTNMMALLVNCIQKNGPKLIVRESNMPSQAIGQGHMHALFKQLYRLYHIADGIVCPGDAIRDDLCRISGLSEKRVRVIPNPVDMGAMLTSVESSASPYSKHLQRINLLAVGSLTYQKGFDLLLQAMRVLIGQLPDIHLTILGDGGLKPQLESQCDRLGLRNHVTMFGFVDNPFPYIYHADVFVSSSRYEGLPNVILEALACGTPVVAFNCPGCVREILLTERQGLLVPPADIDALAMGIKIILDRSRHKDRRSRLPVRFSMERIICQYEDLIAQTAVM